jgi:hypothetical protein
MVLFRPDGKLAFVPSSFTLEMDAIDTATFQSVNLADDAAGAGDPVEGLRVAVVVRDIVVDGADEIAHAAERTSADVGEEPLRCLFSYAAEKSVGRPPAAFSNARSIASAATSSPRRWAVTFLKYNALSR